MQTSTAFRPLATAFIISAVAAHGILFLQRNIDGNILTAQSSGRIPINVFTEEKAALGFIAKANQHNIWRCTNQPFFSNDILGSVAKLTENSFLAWAYEFSGQESARKRAGLRPFFNGRFWISALQIAQIPQLASLNTLTKIVSGNLYYLMTEKDLLVQCPKESGVIETIYNCGNGRVEPEQIYAHLEINHPKEECDDLNINNDDGCSSVCKEETGWTCEGEPSHCERFIPNPGDGSSSSSEDWKSCGAEFMCTKAIFANNQCTTMIIDCSSSEKLVCDGGTCGRSACEDRCCRCVGIQSSSSSPPPPPPPSEGWEKVTTLPDEFPGTQLDTPLVWLDGKLLALGGFNANGTHNPSVYALNPSTKTWGKFGQLPDNRYYFSAGVLGLDLVIAGGYGGENWTYATRDAKTWTRMPPIPMTIFNAASIAHNGTLITVGGQTITQPNTSHYTTNVLSFNANSGWKYETDIPQAESFAAAAIVDGNVVRAGGFIEGSGPTKNVSELRNAHWEPLTAFQQSRYGHAFFAIEKYLFVIGGVTGIGETTETDVKNTLGWTGTQWKAGLPLPPNEMAKAKNTSFWSRLLAQGAPPTSTGQPVRGTQDADGNVWVKLSDGSIYRISKQSLLNFVGATPGGAKQCSDGKDNDGDGKIDWPQDNGCYSPEDPTEDTVCSDGIDNDSDGTIDFPADAGCVSIEDDNELGGQTEIEVTNLGPEQTKRNGIITYQINVKNNGPDGLSYPTPLVIGFTDGMTFDPTQSTRSCVLSRPRTVICEGFTLRSGASKQFAITFKVSADAACNSKLVVSAFVSGGLDPNENNNRSTVETKVECEDLAACQELSWTEAGTNALPIPLSDSASVTTSEQMFEIGGYSGAGSSRNVLSSTDGTTWKYVGSNPLPVGLNHHSTAVLGNTIYVLGGSRDSATGPVLSNDVYASSNGGLAWNRVGNLPIALAGHATVAIDGAMIVIGGDTPVGSNHVYTDAVYASSNGINWELVGRLPSGLAFHSAAIINGRIVVAGGLTNNGGGSSAMVFVSDDKGAHWESIPTSIIPVGTVGAAMVNFDGALWLTGGNWSKDVYRSEDGKAWQAVGGSSLPEGIVNHTAVSFGNKIFVIGGNTVSQENGSRKVYEATCASRDSGPLDCSPGASCQSTLDCPEGMYCAGAIDGGPQNCYRNGCIPPP